MRHTLAGHVGASRKEKGERGRDKAAASSFTFSLERGGKGKREEKKEAHTKVPRLHCIFLGERVQSPSSF